MEYYGQPFVSAGKYSQFKKITVPDAENYEDRYHIFSDKEILYDAEAGVYNVDENLDQLTEYFFNNPDFNFQEFCSNLVVRWEYLPGSTLFFVWSQGRNHSAYDGTFSYASDIKPTGLFSRQQCISHKDILLVACALIEKSVNSKSVKI